MIHHAVAPAMWRAIGFTPASEADIWNIVPATVRTVLGENVVAVVFVVILSLVLPKDMDIKKVASTAD